MENQDFFLEIAKTKHPIDSTDREILAASGKQPCVKTKRDVFSEAEKKKRVLKNKSSGLQKNWKPCVRSTARFFANYCKEISGEAQTEELKDSVSAIWRKMSASQIGIIREKNGRP